MKDLATRASTLDEQIQRMRKDLDAAKAELDEYAVLNPQQCPAGKHADWLVDSEYTHACPWCQIEELKGRVAELERPAVEAKRNEIRDSYAETIAMAREDRDYEGAFTLECQLREREEKWKAEDSTETSR